MKDEALQALVAESMRRADKPNKVAINLRIEEDLYVPMLERLTKALNASQTDVFKAGLVILAEKVATGRYKSIREVLTAK